MGKAWKVVAVVMVMGFAGAACAQDWPQWRGANSDGKAAGFKAPTTWAKELAEGWKVTVGAGDASPVLVGDKLYVFTRQGEEEVLMCLNAADGKEVWKKTYAAGGAKGPAAGAHSGPRSTPAVGGGKVVTLGLTGILTCWDAKDGKQAWKNEEFANVVPKFYTASSPMIMDGTVVAELGGEGKGAIVALELATGKEKWRWAGEAPQYSSPVVMTAGGVKQVVTLTEKSVVGLSAADGKLLWQVAFVPEGRAYNSATPIVEGDTVIVTGAGRGTKALKIEKTADGFAAKELWANADTAVQFNTPVLSGGMLFGMTNKGLLFALDSAKGEAKWTDTTQRSRQGFCAMVEAGGVIFALPDNGELLVIKPDAKEYTELAKYKVAETPTFATPIVAGSRIFVKDQDALRVWEIK